MTLHLLEDANGRSTDQRVLDSLVELSRGTIAERKAPVEFTYLSRAFSSLTSLRSLSIWERPAVPDDLSWLPGLYQHFKRRCPDIQGIHRHGIFGYELCCNGPVEQLTLCPISTCPKPGFALSPKFAAVK